MTYEEAVDILKASNLYNDRFCITKSDWEFIEKVLKKYNIKNVLEIGSGISTLLFSKIVNVVAYDTNKDYANRFSKFGLDIRLGEYPDIKSEMIFVDGPWKGETRGDATKYASEHSDMVITHDSRREWEKKWHEMYMGQFDMVDKGGNRTCALWIRRQ
jgi:hypothetical protein